MSIITVPSDKKDVLICADQLYREAVAAVATKALVPTAEARGGKKTGKASAPPGKALSGKTSNPCKDSCTSFGKRASSERCVPIEDMPESSANRSKRSKVTPPETKKEVRSKKKVLKKEYGTAAATKLGLQKKAPAKRNPISKARASTQETMQFTLEHREEEDDASGKNKRKERVRKTIARVIGRPSMMRDEDEDEEEEEPAAPPAKSQKLMADAIKTGAAPSKPKSAPSPQLQLKHPSQLLQRDILGTSQLQRRTRPQCLRSKKMMSH
nr:uncharacterized protein LOC120975767 [Aegilops tauschii subsp. strangulata]